MKLLKRVVLDYYSLKLAAEMLGCTEETLILLAAQNKLTVCVLMPKKPIYCWFNDKNYYDGELAWSFAPICEIPARTFREYLADNSAPLDVVKSHKTGDDIFEKDIYCRLINDIPLNDAQLIVMADEVQRLFDVTDSFEINENLSETNNQNHEDERISDTLKLIFVMAVDRYDYDPNGTRNEATGNSGGAINSKISSHIKERIDNATIKNCLNRAEELLGLPKKETKKKTSQPQLKKLSLVFVGMAIEGYKHPDTNKLIKAITRINNKLSLNINIDSAVIERILNEARQELSAKLQQRRET